MSENLEQLEDSAKEVLSRVEVLAKPLEESVKTEAVKVAQTLSGPFWKGPLFWLIAALIFIGLLVAGIWIFKATRAPKSPTAGFIQAAPAHGMPETATETVQPSVPLKSYNKTTAAKKMNLVAEIVSDPKKALLSTATVPASEGGYTSATVLDTTTGESSTIIKEQPRPWFGLGGDGGVGIRGGISGPGGVTGSLYVRQKLVRVLDVQVSAYAEANGSETRSPEVKAMVEVELYRWK